MRTIKTCLMVAVILLMGVVAGAEDNKPTTRPVSWNTTMPSIPLSHRPLEDVLKELKQKLPGFDYQISRMNAPHDYPVLWDLTVENVTLQQFLSYVSQHSPGTNISFNGTETGLLCQLMIADVTAQPGTETTTLQIIGLADIIATRALRMAEPAKQATDDVLSLIQAALDEVHSTVKPEMKLHPATQVLICKVTQEQYEAINQAINALRSSEPKAWPVEWGENKNRTATTLESTTQPVK